VLIHQDADLFVARPEAGATLRRDLDPGRRAYVHVVRGEARVNGLKLASGDALKVERETRSPGRGPRGRSPSLRSPLKGAFPMNTLANRGLNVPRSALPAWPMRPR
jgi:hypothetical protein